MRPRVALVYNKPVPSRYDTTGENKAVIGVLESVEAANEALLELGYDVAQLPLVPPIEQVREKLKVLDVDLVFNLFEGFCGYPETEALLPEIASELGIPCTGCSPSILRLGLDKAKAKDRMKAAGIITPSHQVLTPKTVSEFRLRYPCIVKPCAEDASHGISDKSLVTDFVSLKRQVTAVSNAYGGRALVEEFIDGREFNATAIGNTRVSILPISEITYSLPAGMPRILTFDAKWEEGSPYFEGTKVACPAQISAEEQEKIRKTVLAVFRTLKCRGYARVDMRIDEAGRVNVIELNPNPEISPGSGAARQAEAVGMTYAQFIDKIVSLALE